MLHRCIYIKNHPIFPVTGDLSLSPVVIHNLVNFGPISNLPPLHPILPPLQLYFLQHLSPNQLTHPNLFHRIGYHAQPYRNII